MCAGREFERLVFAVSYSAADVLSIDRDAYGGEGAGLISAIEVYTPTIIRGWGCDFERRADSGLRACRGEADEKEQG